MPRTPQKQRLAVLAVSMIGWALGVPMTGHGETGGVPDARIDRLAKGINLPGWLWLNRRSVTEMDKRYPDADFDLIKRLGFTHVRIPIDMANVYDQTQPDLLDQTCVGHLDRGIEQILSHKLAIIIDMHSISQRDGGSTNGTVRPAPRRCAGLSGRKFQSPMSTATNCGSAARDCTSCLRSR